MSILYGIKICLTLDIDTTLLNLQHFAHLKIR